MDADGKRSLIQKYKTEGGIKNLAWVCNYLETSKDEHVESSQVKKGFFYATEILKMNGFDSSSPDSKESKAILDGLLQDCYAEFNIDPTKTEVKQENKKVPVLTKYYYMKGSQQAVHSSSSNFQMEMNLDLNLSKAMDAAAGASSSAGIKVENPTWVLVNKELQLVRPMKDRLEKIFNEAVSCNKDLEAEGKPEALPMLKSCQKPFEEAGKFQDKVRALLAECKAFTVSTDQALLQKKLPDLQACVTAGSHHIEGLKALAKRLKLMLQ